jgi:hypothetical protein
MRPRHLLAAWTVAGMFMAGGGAFGVVSGQAVRHPDPSAPLAQRLAWGLEQGERLGGSAFWVGYSIERLMNERSFIGSWSGEREGDRRTLEEIIAGRPPAAADNRAALEKAARQALDGIDGRTTPEKLVRKDIGLLLKLTPASGRTVQDVRVSDLKLRVDLEGWPLAWLGPASEAESVDLLKALFKDTDGKSRERLIHAVAMHRAPEVVVPFLAGVVSSSEPAKVLRAAAFGLGEQSDPRAVAALAKTLSSDRPTEVKKAAVWGLAENGHPSALEALIGTATAAPDPAVRKEAVMGLAQKASAKAVRTLERLAFDDRDVEVQKRAVFALAELPDKEALPYLVRVAKTHHRPEVRKAAIFALGDMGGPEVVAVLAEIARGPAR